MRTAVYNTIAAIFFILTLASLTLIVWLLVTPPPAPDPGDLPTVAPDLPTLTPSNTYTATFPPTFTPSPTFTPTNTPSPTASSTMTPSATITMSPTITPTPGPTDTPSETPLPSPTPTPTGPTPIPSATEIPYPFVQRGATRFVQNFANTLGCAWQGIGGQVFNQDGTEATTQFRVRVFNNTFDQIATTGSNSFYGPTSGWEVQVDTTVNTNTYFVRLETLQGTQISPRIEVTFTGNCAQNAALVDFERIR